MRRIRTEAPPAIVPWDAYEHFAREGLDMLCAGDFEGPRALRDYFQMANWGDVWLYDNKFEIEFDPLPNMPPPRIEGVMGDITAECSNGEGPPLSGMLLLWDSGEALFEVYAYADALPANIEAYRWTYAYLRPQPSGAVMRTPCHERDPDSFWKLDLRKD